MKESIKEILAYNKKFVEERKYEAFKTNKYPDRKIAILACMDTRLIELLPAALGIKNGDVKMIKNAGALVTHPFGSVMKSFIVAIYELGVEDILVIAHKGCGMEDMKCIKDNMINKGVKLETLDMIRSCGIDIDAWLDGFSCTEEAVMQTVAKIKGHPLIPDYVGVYGFVMDSETGELEEV